MSENTSLVLEVFTDYVCPWCYLASGVVEKLEASSKEVEVRWSPFPLHPDTPQEGLLLESFLGPNLDAVHERLYGLMDELGLEHCDRTMTYNSRLAQELGMWADEQVASDKAKAFHRALYRAYFARDHNLANKEVLMDVVDSSGLDVTAAEQVIDERSYSDQVDGAWARARQLQISGVPSFIAGSYMATGFQPYEEILKFLEYVEIQQARG